MVFDHGRVHAGELGARLFESYAGGEASEQFGHAMHASSDHGGGKVVRAANHIGDDLGLCGVRVRWFEDADDGRAARSQAIEADSFADHGGIALEHGGPETMRKYHSAGSIRAIVSHVE